MSALLLPKQLLFGRHPAEITVVDGLGEDSLIRLGRNLSCLLTIKRRADCLSLVRHSFVCASIMSQNAHGSWSWLLCWWLLAPPPEALLPPSPPHPPPRAVRIIKLTDPCRQCPGVGWVSWLRGVRGQLTALAMADVLSQRTTVCVIIRINKLSRPSPRASDTNVHNSKLTSS